MSYNIPIPEPKLLVQKIARIYFGTEALYEVFWLAATRQVVFHITNIRALSDPEAQEDCKDSEWFIQPDGNIVDALCYFLPFHHYQILLENIVVFEDQSLKDGKFADQYALSYIYDCEWSDFACDKMVLYMDAVGDPYLHNEQERLLSIQWRDPNDEPHGFDLENEYVCNSCGLFNEKTYRRQDQICEECGALCEAY